MERDFEKEFIELKLNEVPDLWNRIEAGLSEKNIVNSVSGNHSGSGKKYMAKKTAWRKWGTLAAACLCVAIIYPMISLVLRNMGKDSSYSGSPASDTAAGASENAVMTEEADSMSDAAPAEDFVSEGDGAVESLDNAGSVNAAGNADVAESTAEAVEETAQDMDAANSLQNDATEEAEAKRSDITDMAEEAEQENASVFASLEDGQILEDVVVSVSKVDASGDTDLYQAVVLQADADMALTSNMQIEIVCDSGTEYDFLREPREKKALKAGDSYILSLRYEEAENRFTVITAVLEK